MPITPKLSSVMNTDSELNVLSLTARLRCSQCGTVLQFHCARFDNHPLTFFRHHCPHYLCDWDFLLCICARTDAPTPLLAAVTTSR